VTQPQRTVIGSSTSVISKRSPLTQSQRNANLVAFLAALLVAVWFLTACERSSTRVPTFSRDVDLGQEIRLMRGELARRQQFQSSADRPSALEARMLRVRQYPYRVCSLDSYSTLRCVRLASMLAVFNDQFATALVEELELVFEALDVDESDLLILCDGKRWTVAEASAALTLGREGDEYIREICFNSPAKSIAIAPGSLIAGSPTYRAQDENCGFSIPTGDPSMEQMMGMIAEIVESAGEGCGISLQGTLMEGGDDDSESDPPPDDPPEDPPPDDPPEDPPPDDPPEDPPPDDPHIEEGSGINPNTGNFGHWIRDCIGSSCTPKVWRDAHIVDCTVDGPECQQCSHAQNLIDDCMRSAGRAPSCQRAMEHFSCCQSIPGDPRITLPDPNGNLTCRSKDEEKLTVEACERKCSVASDTKQDCLALCESAVLAERGSWNILDAVCIYAYWEACAGGKAPTPTPENAGDGTPPLPYAQFRFAVEESGTPGRQGEIR
jgi:hypothetical protein